MTGRAGASVLELVRVSAPARRLDARAFDGGPCARRVVCDLADLAALQMRGAVRIDEDLDALRLDDTVIVRRRIVPTELVGHAGTATADHADPAGPPGLA